MLFDPYPPFTCPSYRVKFATEAWERQGAASLRRLVFCREQGLFGADDRDAIDDRATCLVALSTLVIANDAVVGTVRIHEDEPGIWWGSRLAVEPNHRRVGALGVALIRLAVSSAHARGATRFLAHVQSQNVPLFQKLAWTSHGERDLHGRPHHFMEADLAAYPAYHGGAEGFVSLARRAA